MNPAKSELKMSVLSDVGVRMDDKLDEAHRRVATHGGAKQALRVLSKGIAGLAELVDKALDDGDIPDEPLKVAEFAKKMIERASIMAATAGQHQENLEITASGAVQAYDDVVKMLKKDVDSEVAKAMSFREAVESGEIVIEDGVGPVSQNGRSRPTGVKPGMSISQQRKAEAAAEKVAETPMDDAPGEEPADVEEKPKKKRRGRPKKAD